MTKVWLDQYPPEIPTELSLRSVPVHTYLTEAAELYGDKVAVHFMGFEMTYKELHQQALQCGRALVDSGIKQGDRVAIMLPNCPQSIISYYGILYAGGIVVQMNPLYVEREIEYQLKDAGAKAIITLDILYPRVMSVKAQTDVKQVIVTGIKDYLPFPKNMLYPFVQKKQYGIVVKVTHGEESKVWKTFLKEGKGELPKLDLNFEEDLALLQYTGGTTGFPKGVMLTHKNLVANASMCDAWLYKCKKGEEVVLGLLPFFHVYGMTAVLILSVMQGYKMVLLPKFDPETTLKTIQKQRATLFPGAPTIYIGLLNHPNLKEYDITSVHSGISGSAPLPVEIQEQFEKVIDGRLVEGYGLTETSPVTHSNFLWGDNRRKGSIGVPWPSTDAQIWSLGGTEVLQPKEIGEIVVSGPQVMKGYWNRQEETDAVLFDGWLRTGDIGYMDEDGFFYVVDRKKDMIIAGGYNIYPREIEEILYEHESVQEVVVAGVPDPYRGETVKAYVVVKKGHSVTEQDLDAFTRKMLAAYKVPRIYEFREELPKTAVGKILRRVLIDEEKKKLTEEEIKSS
ncbi:AMP-binding protein [Mangrovibacillus cuniculi]|uniref:AMP-binding protein n=1 Tax=Mangrovibacillus cuniculi TaxID=2593652 RepID=A0A7S8HFW3_9BACI|nr:AMP-binding protein [Mangrovibacillus cuniculi]QPC47167.1 AMP-binding protein [Mangrovibacillus cuniculi]